jgi:cation transport ATPase
MGMLEKVKEAQKNSWEKGKKMREDAKTDWKEAKEEYKEGMSGIKEEWREEKGEIKKDLKEWKEQRKANEKKAGSRDKLMSWVNLVYMLPLFLIGGVIVIFIIFAIITSIF